MENKIRNKVNKLIEDKEWVHKTKSTDEKETLIEHYYEIGGIKLTIKKVSAIKSLNSLFESNDILWENPIPEPEWFVSEDGRGHIDDIWIEEYQKHEQNVFNKSRTYLFKKIL